MEAEEGHGFLADIEEGFSLFSYNHKEDEEKEGDSEDSSAYKAWKVFPAEVRVALTHLGILILEFIEGLPMAIIQVADSAPLLGIILAVGIVWIFADYVFVFKMPKIVASVVNGFLYMIQKITKALNEVPKFFSKIGSGIAHLFHHHGFSLPSIPILTDDDLLGDGFEDYERWPTVCKPYRNWRFVLASMFKRLLNKSVCPVARTLYPAPWLFRMFDTLFYWMYFDPTPDPGNNCAQPEDFWICEIMGFGYVVFDFFPVFILVCIAFIAWGPKFYATAIEEVWEIFLSVILFIRMILSFFRHRVWRRNVSLEETVEEEEIDEIEERLDVVEEDVSYLSEIVLSLQKRLSGGRKKS